MTALLKKFMAGYDVRGIMKRNWLPEGCYEDEINRHANPRRFRQEHQQVAMLVERCKNHPTKASLTDLRRALRVRIASRTAVERLLARLLCGANNSHAMYVNVYCKENGRREVHMRNTVVMCDGVLCLRTECRYDFVTNSYISPQQYRQMFPRIFVSAQAYQDMGGAPTRAGGDSDTGFTYNGYPPQSNDSYPATMEVRGEVFHLVTRLNGNQCYLSENLLQNRHALAEWDGSAVLEHLTRLQSRSSTAMLKGQPELAPNEAAIGIELELDGITNHASYVERITDFLRGKLGWRGSVTAVSDGSLGENGAEFVTGWGNPSLVAGAVEELMRNDKFMLRQVQRDGTPVHCTSRSSVHIHVSRTYFDNVQHVANVQWVVEREAFRPVVERVSRRYNTRYCEAAKNVTRYSSPRSGKYRAVNCQHNASIEFRIFSAPLLDGDMLRYKDFVLSTIDWARTSPRIWTVRAYGKWLAAQPQFAMLHSFLADLFVVTEAEEMPAAQALDVGALVASNRAAALVPMAEYEARIAVARLMAEQAGTYSTPQPVTPMPRPSVTMADFEDSSQPVVSEDDFF